MTTYYRIHVGSLTLGIRDGVRIEGVGDEPSYASTRAARFVEASHA